MVDSGRINKLIAAVPAALALRAGLDLGIFTRLGGSAVTADSLGANTVPLTWLSKRGT
ncbi:hypothetical protein [Mesorhizobium sp. M1329]|uniref:hypothetical protein n=1 Tax=Mesorhizobium sp. M1329 TaxID=2957083 RepID=UPI0033368E96